MNSQARVWALIGALAAVAVPASWLAQRTGEGYQVSVTVPWLALAATYMAAELAVVHLHFRRDAHSFSMTETALVVGLLCSSPHAMVTAQLAGCAAALLYRRQSLAKLCFNLANFAVGTSSALLVFHALVPSSGGLGIGVWLTAFVAALTSGVLNGAMVTVVISLTDGRLDVRRLPTVFVMACASAVTNASLALVAAILLEQDAAAVALLAVPAVTVYLAYRAYLREREKHESLEFLHQSTRILSDTPQLEEAILRLLHQARAMFHAETASVVFTAPGRDRMLRTSVGGDGNVSLMQPVHDAQTHELWERLSGASRSCVLIRRPASDPLLQAFLDGNHMRDAMVGLLYGEAGPYGLIVVGNRLGEVTSFDPEDLRVFETLANHASVALENGRLEQSLAQLRELEQRLKRLAYHDPLTGLANRSLFADRVDSALTRSGASSGDCAVLFIDLDDFKTVNDTLGHATGDQLLCAIAERLAGCLRPEDTAARLGGDEFAVLVEDVEGPLDVERVADRIAEALRRPVSCGGHDVPVRASIGIAPGGGATSADELLRNADLAMYMAKSDGLGSYRTFEPGMRTEVVQRHRLKGDLVKAVDDDQLTVHYQPIVDLHSGRPVAVEALVRWEHPDLGLVEPATFLAIAEQAGLAVRIGNYVLRTACATVAEWQRELDDAADECKGGRSPIGLAVNLSPAQVRLPGLVTEVASALADTGLEPSSLLLEISEGLVLDDGGATLDTLHRLRALGVRVVVDDFGTGYASLAHLRRLPLDSLKIARTFVDDLDGDPDAAAFASAVVGIGAALGLSTLAEGVERPRQVAALRRLGCTLGQGTHFAASMPAGEAADYLRHGKDGSADLARVIGFPA